MVLSIIVPFYNMAADGKIEYCLNSLLSQSVQEYEIIAVDDDSTDNTLTILRKYEAENPGKVQVIASSVNHHQGGARNLGIKAATGKYLGFMDGDDWAAPDMFEKLISKAEETGADVVGCDYNIVHTHTMEVGKIIPMNTAEQTGILTEEKKRLLILRPGSMVVKIYRREIIVDNGLWFPEDIFYEDNCMAPLWMLHCTHFERVDEPLYYYYQHDASTVHHISLQKCRDRMTAMDLLLEKSRQYGFYETYLPELNFKYAELFFVNTLFSCMQGRMRHKYRFVKELTKRMKQTFPDFTENVYYREKMDGEVQKLIRLLLQSQPAFFAYYHALHFYRKLRKRG